MLTKKKFLYCIKAFTKLTIVSPLIDLIINHLEKQNIVNLADATILIFQFVNGASPLDFQIHLNTTTFSDKLIHFPIELIIKRLMIIFRSCSAFFF